MMALNRTIEPPIKTIDSIAIPKVEKIQLDNGVPVYIINEGEQDVVKIELMFRAGKWYEEKNLVGDLTARMLREGTRKHTAKQIADAFDFYGANMDTSAGFEMASVTLYSLTKYVDNLLPLFHEVITVSVFPPGEFQTIIDNRKQRLKIDLEKNDFVANRNFVSAVFGSKHPYGRVTGFENFDVLSTSDLQSFYSKYYNASNLTIIVAGRFNEALIKNLNKFFGEKNFLGVPAPAGISHPIEQSEEWVHHIEKEDSVQSSLSVGNLSIGKTHPDYLKLSVLNTLFGGYFGSRLMSNIREEKGYTYGIYSSLVSYPHAAFIEIGAEVQKEAREASLKEIAHEINTLRNEPVGAEELQIVKNYISGKILRSIDGPLKFSESLKNLIIYGQDTSHIRLFLDTVKTVNSEELQRLANQYFNYDKMYKVTVG